jgi:hypothetical protein
MTHTSKMTTLKGVTFMCDINFDIHVCGFYTHDCSLDKQGFATLYFSLRYIVTL